MRAHTLVPAIAVAAVLLLPGRAAAQRPSPQAAAAMLQLSPPEPALPDRPALPGALHAVPDGTAPKRKDHTALGLMIGGALGFAAGWGFYNAMCEAADNQCNNSRVPYLVIGTMAGAALGGAAGSAAD